MRSLAIVIMAIMVVGASGILLWKAGATFVDQSKRSISILYTPWKPNALDNMEMVMIASEESNIPVKGNAIGKFVVVMSLLVLAGTAVAVIVFVTLCYVTKPVVKDNSEDEWDLPHTISGGK